jgi:hypothetical protein
MNDKTKIMIGIVAAVVVAAFPIWYTLAAADETGRPELETPPEGSQCVREKAFMTGNHMNLLDDWRNAVVRDGQWMAPGQDYPMSLTRTCLSCHSKEAFCQRCHDYANVSPTCWDCHVESEGS